MKTYSLFFVMSFFFIGAAKSQCVNCTDSATINKDLTLCLPFNGNANDETGNGHSGTVTGASLSLDRFGSNNKSYSFNGVNNYMTIPHSPDLSFGSDSTFSVGFWYKANSAASFSSIITKSEQSDTSGYAIGFDNVGRFRFISNLMYEVKTTKVLPLNTWQFYCMTFNTKNEIKIYVNGLLDTTGKVTSLKLNTRDIKLGRLYTNTTGYFFNGNIDDLRIYNRVLSSNEVSELANNNCCVGCTNLTPLNNNLTMCLPFNGNANDEAGHGHSGAVTGASLSMDRFGGNNKSYSFNGVNNYITIPHSSDLSFGSDSTFSVGFWYKANSASSFSSVITKSEQSDTSGYAIGFDNVGRFRFISNLMYEVKTTKVLPLNTWQFYCMTFNTKNEIRIYVNGVLDTTGMVTSLKLNSRDIKIGRLYTNTTGYFFNGNIDDLRIYNRVLSSAEVSDLYSCSPVITTTGFYEIESKEKNRVVVYPNPLVGGSLSIEFSSAVGDDVVIDFYDVSGNKIYSIDKTGIEHKSSESIMISNLKLAKGIYYIRILNGNELSNRLLVVDEL